MSLCMGLSRRSIDLEGKLRASGVKQGQTVLDFGCGPGYFTIVAARTVGERGRVYALDVHPLAIEAVEEKARKGGLSNITTVLSDRDTGLPDGSVDVVLLYDTIHQIEDKQALLGELDRVLKAGGVLSIWVEHGGGNDVAEVVQDCSRFSLKERREDILNFVR